MKDCILVLPATKSQIPLIQELKALNYDILCISPDENSPAFKYSNYHVIGDILDKDFCLETAKKYKVVAVMSDECDIAVPTVAYISEKLNLLSIGSDMARLYTDKYKMREYCSKKNFPYPDYKMCRNTEECIEFFNSLKSKKMIVKPLDSNSSRGVFTVTHTDEIEKIFKESIIYSKINKAVICEEYIEGPEFTIDGIVVNSKHYSLAISRKKHYDYNKNIACELFFSSYDSEVDYNLLRKQNDKYVNKTGLPFGLTHAEYKWNGKEFVLIEIGARGGGNFISSHIVPALYDIDSYKILLNSILGKINDDIKEVPKDREKCVVLKFFDVTCNGGRVIDIENVDLLSKNKDVLLYEFRFKKGDVIKKAESDSARVGFYIAQKNTRQELINFINKVDKIVKIKFDEV